MSRVVRRPEALEDALSIWCYIALDDVAAADRLSDGLDRRIKQLAEMPLMGQSRLDFRPELRSVTLGNYLIFYEPLPDGVDVVRILHGARDIARELRPD